MRKTTAIMLSLLIGMVFAESIQLKEGEAEKGQANFEKKEDIRKTPFAEDVTLQSIGLVLMIILITLSSAGGLSGAGSNIPIMLIFYKLSMQEAVPISSFVAVASTLFRFILNFNEVHPTRPERNTINYEIVLIVMPAVFFGAFVGVYIGNNISEIAKVIIFGVTVAWSIYTSSKKAIKLLEEEKLQDDIKDGKTSAIDENMALIDSALLYPEMETDVSEQNQQCPELESIKYEEKHHITCQKVTLIGISFVNLFTCQFLFGSKAAASPLPDWGKWTSFGVFTIVSLLLTIYSAKKIQKVQEDKIKFNYNFDKKDQRFDSINEVAKLAIFCAIAAILCGCTGIAGGMVLGPLFLSYNMIPTIMSATNQFITLIASISVAIQFAYQGQMLYEFSALFGGVTIFCVFAGIKGVNIYIKQSGGKQSVIAIILTSCLVIALVSLPLKFIFLSPKADSKNDE